MGREIRFPSIPSPTYMSLLFQILTYLLEEWVTCIKGPLMMEPPYLQSMDRVRPGKWFGSRRFKFDTIEFRAETS